MDLSSYLGDYEDDIFRGSSPLGWEDSEIFLGSQSGTDLSQGDLQDDTTESITDESGPLLRCLKKIYRKGKKEKTRRRKTMTSVPDLSAMATIWEESENPGSAQEPELLLNSWRSTIDYFNSKKEEDVMKKSFFRFLSILSKTINWSNMTDFFMDNFTSDVVGVLTEMIKRDFPESSVVCLHAMATVIDLSKANVTKTMGSYKKGILLRTFFKSVFALSPLKAGQEEGAANSANAQYAKNLFIRTYQTFSEMLQQLMVENPIPSELERILQLMAPWLQSSEADLRERAIWTSASLLNFVASKLQLDTLSKFSRLGHLVAVLGICCGDAVKSISSKAAKSVHLLLAIVLGQKIARLDEKNVHTEAIKRKHKEFLESWNPSVFLKNPSRVAEVFGVYFSPREKTDFILTALDGLTVQCTTQCCATTEGLLASMARHCGAEIEKVSDIVDGICSRLDLIHQPSARRLVMKLVGLLAGRTEHLDTVISSLLEHSFPPDSNSSELWQSLSTEEVVEEQLMENLLARLQDHHSTELQTSAASIAITQALYEVISVPESKDTIQRLYPDLLTALLIELYFSNQAEALPDMNFLRKQCGRGENLASFSAEALKLLLIRTGCRYEVTFMERTRGWSMLQSAREVLQGATLLARAMLHFACPETMRILDMMFSLLSKGSKKLKPTTIAFFVELLHYQEIEQLPADQIFESLEEWTRNPSPDVRSLGLRALGILAIHPDKVEEVKTLMPTLLGSLEEADGVVVAEGITAIQNLLKFMQRSDIVSLAEKLLPLFSNAEARTRNSAIALFAELPNVVKKKEKYLIQEQVTQSLLPLLLHLQDEEPEVVKGCQDALARCFRFLGWSLPKKINSKKAWHDHPQIAETLCRQISWKVKTIPAILLQCLDHLQCPQVSIRRAAAIFLGCVAQCAEPVAITQEKKDLIFLSLSKLRQDHDPSVRLTALQATRMVQEACGVSAAVSPRFSGSEGEDSLSSDRGHWDTPDPALTHRWNPASPTSHRLVPSAARKRGFGPTRQA
ncbi:maestro heat-like repeat-containing protein family member 7 isoform X1 [Podarcis lilfordi]|nr:maestro heat-like repeat-containing protein family member 7 isoform X1 [Podarcis lilfordi]